MREEVVYTIQTRRQSQSLQTFINLRITWTIHSIRELVDSLCRDGADTPIVCIHWKTCFSV